MLPTLAVILWSYGMYALFSFVFQRKDGHPHSRTRRRKVNGVVLAGGLFGLGLVLWCCFSPDKNDQRLKLAGFLGTVYAEGWPDRMDKVEYPPVKSPTQGAGDQPAYALLHPETPTSQMEPEKKLIRPRPGRVNKKKQTAGIHEKSGKTAKVTKTVTPSSKKDKVTAKSRVKKKKNGPTNAG